MTEIIGAVALVTGANRGLGREFAVQLHERGARRIYAAARRPDTIDIEGVEAVALDITDPAQVAAAARRAGDVSLLVNNAGVSTYNGLVAGDLDAIRLEMDTHFYGTLAMVRAFAPVLGANGGGAMLNMLSVLSWLSFEGAGAYGAAKAAEWSLTDSIRLELAGQATQVTAVHVGAVDTDMMAGYDGPKADPVLVVRRALDGLEQGATEVLADEYAAAAKSSLVLDPRQRYAQLTAA